VEQWNNGIVVKRVKQDPLFHPSMSSAQWVKTKATFCKGGFFTKKITTIIFIKFINFLKGKNSIDRYYCEENKLISISK